MAKKEVLNLPGAANRPYSSAIRAGDFVFCSGAIGHVDAKGNPIKGIEAQTKQCMENLKNVLQLTGASIDDVVKVTVFLTNAANWTKMNEVYRTFFKKDLPARSTMITGLVNADMLIEIECIAYKP